MPTKTTKAKRQYEIDGKTFTWTSDEGVKVAIPLRLKMKVLRKIGADRDLDTDTMFEMIEEIAPGQSDVLDEMDANDFTAMFTAWQEEYQKLSGASLGE